MRRWGIPGLVVGAALLLSSCGMLLAGLATDFSLEVVTDDVTIARGESAPITVRVSQTLPVDVVPTDIVVNLHNPPTGVSAAELTIPNGIDQDDLIVEVDLSASVGGPLDVLVRATNGIETREATFQLTIVDP